MSKAPLRIAIIGAPKSGKSRVAKGLAKEVKDLLGETIIVDKYVDKLQKDTGLAFGQFATYTENFVVAGARHAAERKALNSGKSVITVGTAIESFLYAAMVADTELQRANPQAAIKAATSAMGGMGLILAQTYDYDATIYLPYAPAKGKSEYWSQMVDSHIQDVTVNFSIPLSVVEGTISERIQKAKRVVEYAYETSPEVEAFNGPTEVEGGEASE